MVWAVSLSTTKLIPRSLTPGLGLVAFGVWLRLVASRPLAHPVLYLHKLSPEAAPKCISGRTSYLRVRLAFHPYPQLIPALCHVHGFGPPPKVSWVSSWPWVAHPVSCLIPATFPIREDALFGLAFATAPRLKSLNLATEINSPAHSSIGTPSPELPQALTACRHRVSGSISLPSRGAFHLSLTVLVHYRSLAVFSLGRWSPLLPTGFHVSHGTQGHWQEPSPFAYGTVTLYG